MTAVNRSSENRTVVVVGRFADPSKAPNYSSGVGQAMSDAYARALLHEGSFDVWINPQLTREVEAAISLPTREHEQALGEIGRTNPDVHYVIAGKVTDFYHSSDLPAEVTRWGIFGRRNEAVVAVDFRVVDLKTRRVVGADHLNGTAHAGSSPSGDIYGGVALDSYVFWSSPLGRASRDVIAQAVDRTMRVVPGRVGDARVLGKQSRRRITISGGSEAGLVSGREYYLVLTSRLAEDTLIRDPITERPVTVRIESASRNAARGFLTGAVPIEQDIRGAVLRSSRPATSPPAEQQVTAASDDSVDR